MPLTDDTDLIISGMGIPRWSARGLDQTLQPDPASISMRRTVNGDLLDLSSSQFRKYQSTITCRDHRTPAIEGIWPGQELTVDCIAELSYETMSGSPSRTVVEGSERVENDYTFYRPRLSMRVAGFRTSRDEFADEVAWTLELVEV